jgi:hypothetical protein
LRSHSFYDVITAYAVSRHDARNPRFDRRYNNDRRVALLPIVTLEEQWNDVHRDVVAGFGLNFGRACSHGGMNDGVQGIALALIRKYDCGQRRAIDPAITNHLWPPRCNRSKAWCPRLDDFTRKLIGVDNRRAELRERTRYLALSRANSAGEPHAQHY